MLLLIIFFLSLPFPELRYWNYPFLFPSPKVIPAHPWLREVMTWPPSRNLSCPEKKISSHLFEKVERETINWEGQLLQSLDVWKISCSGTIWRFPILWIEIKVGREGICQQKLFFQLWFPQKPLTVEWFGISKSPGWIVVNFLGFSICFSCISRLDSTLLFSIQYLFFSIFTPL